MTIPHAAALQLLAALTTNGILHEQCACGCDLALHFPWRPEGEPAPPIHDASFCRACWSDRCNSYRPVYVLDKRAADAYDRKHCEHKAVDIPDFGPVTCEACGVEMEFTGDGIDRTLDGYAPIDDSEPESGSLATFLEDHEL
jgi:hypothetical protein